MDETLHGIENQLDQPLGDHYHRRILAHMDDSYLGARMRKFPEDLRTYEHLLWETRADTVIEIGLGHGGSALWLRDRLRTLATYRRTPRATVISVDRDISTGRANLERVDPDYAETIRLVQADVRDPSVVERVHDHLHGDARVLVIDDSAHRYDTTLATLRGFSPLVPPGGYIVVEDGHRDLPGMLPPSMPVGEAHGVTTAIDDWLTNEAGGRFEMRRDQERYLVTSNPRGFLQRVG